VTAASASVAVFAVATRVQLQLSLQTFNVASTPASAAMVPYSINTYCKCYHKNGVYCVITIILIIIGSIATTSSSSLVQQ
jgi:hypothetical protein